MIGSYFWNFSAPLNTNFPRGARVLPPKCLKWRLKIFLESGLQDPYSQVNVEVHFSMGPSDSDYNRVEGLGRLSLRFGASRISPARACLAFHVLHSSDDQVSGWKTITLLHHNHHWVPTLTNMVHLETQKEDQSYICEVAHNVYCQD